MSLMAIGSGGEGLIVLLMSLKHCGALLFLIYGIHWEFTISFMLFRPITDFLQRNNTSNVIPGDEWVDMVGVDNYGDFGRDGKYNVEAGIKKLKIVSDYAMKAGKLAAFTETGLESIPNTTWWTETLLKALASRKDAIELCIGVEK